MYGIKTIIDYSNYGNRFQNYAVQKILSRYGKVANVDRKYPNKKVKYKYLLWRLSGPVIEKLFPHKDYKYFKMMRFNRFLSYASPEKCDAFFYGSDQIWNPTYGRNDLIIPKYKDKNNIALSASIGIDKIPSKYENIFKRGLPFYSSISVREDNAVEIIKGFTGVEPELLIDPTLYLTANEWRRIAARKIKKTPKNFILLFFLGEISNNRMNKINRFAIQNGLEIVRIFDDKWANLSPEELLYLFDNAQLIITDSFHGTAFSIIFSTPFLVVDREDNQLRMSSRITSLLKIFHMEDRYNHDFSDSLLECDFSNVEDILHEERIKIDRYICNALNRN